MNCVVLGGGGFIGSHLSEALLAKHGRVTVFDRAEALNLELLKQKGIKTIEGNFQNSTNLQKALSGADIVFHLVSTTVPKSSIEDPIFDIESNLVSTINFLNLTVKEGVKKIVFASSGGTVYGIPREIPISENHPTDPICSYGIIKLAIEKYIQLYWTLFGLNYTILRVSNAYGARQAVNSAQGVIPAIIDRELTSRKFTVWGDGSIIRDYIHVSDIVSAFIMASECNEEHRIFNIGSGIGQSVNGIVNTIENLLGKNLDIVYEPGRAYDVPINILNISLAKEILGWEPKIMFIDGINLTLESMRNASQKSQ